MSHRSRMMTMGRYGSDFTTPSSVYHVYEKTPFERPADAIFMTDVSGLTEWVHEYPMLIPEVYLKAVNAASILLLYF